MQRNQGIKDDRPFSNLGYGDDSSLISRINVFKMKISCQ